MRLRRPPSPGRGRPLTGLVVGVVAVLALTACTGSAEDAENDTAETDVAEQYVTSRTTSSWKTKLPCPRWALRCSKLFQMPISN